MALRNQPYIPLYVQDFLTDEKLIECSAEATGVYIRLICVLHKSEEYGKILLKQKDKQTSKHLQNFALKLLKQMPYPIEVIERSLQELIDEGVLTIEDDYLYQKRMVRDNDISIKRSECGKKGGKKTQFASKFAKAKVKANSEYENENEYEDIKEIIDYLNIKTGKKFSYTSKPTQKHISARLSEGRTINDFKKVIDIKVTKWLSDTKMQDYLRPETLFGVKFESYLNEKTTKTSSAVIQDNMTHCVKCGHRRLKSDVDENGICLGRCENATAAL